MALARIKNWIAEVLTAADLNAEFNNILNYLNAGLIPAADGTVGAPGVSFANDLDNGLYRIGANNWALSAGGTKVIELVAALITFATNLTFSAASPTITYGNNWTIVNNGVGGLIFQHNGSNIFQADAAAFYVPGAGTTASAANAFINNAGNNSLLRSTSSLAYKDDVKPISFQDAAAVLDRLRPFTYRSKAVADDKNRRFYGLGAEDVASVEPALVNFTKVKALSPDDPRATDLSEDHAVPDGVQYERICVLLLAERQEMRARIAALEAKVS